MIPRRKPHDGGKQKYSPAVNAILMRMVKAANVGRSPVLQIQGLAQHIRGEQFWNAITAEPDLSVRGMILEAYAKSWARLQKAKWRREEPF